MAATIAQIEDAIVALLQGKLDGARKIDVQKGIEGIPQPAVYVSTEEGKFAKVTMSKYRQDLTIYVDVVFKHLTDERHRREGIYPILAGCVQLLLLQDLGLGIEPIKPRSWRNVTTDELKDNGLIVFELEVETSTYIEKMGEEALDAMLSVALDYYLKPGDAKADASDLVTFPGQED